MKAHGSLDIMFSNAGIGRATLTCDQTVLDMDLSAYDKLMAVNACRMAACVKHAAKAMVEGHVSGSIVCMASIAASVSSENFVDCVMEARGAGVGEVRELEAGGVWDTRELCFTRANWNTIVEGVVRV